MISRSNNVPFPRSVGKRLAPRTDVAAINAIRHAFQVDQQFRKLKTLDKSSAELLMDDVRDPETGKLVEPLATEPTTSKMRINSFDNCC